MKLYQAFATDLNHLLNGARAVRITVPGYMPLSVEEIGVSQDGHRLVSLSSASMGNSMATSSTIGDDFHETSFTVSVRARRTVSCRDCSWL